MCFNFMKLTYEDQSVIVSIGELFMAKVGEKEAFEFMLRLVAA